MRVVRLSTVQCKGCLFFFCADHFFGEVQFCKRCVDIRKKEFGQDGIRLTQNRQKLTKDFIESVIERERI